jgi:phosphatidylglycerophosphatase A
LTNKKHALDASHSLAAMHGMDRVYYWLGVGLGSGLAPRAPGTAASFAILLLVPLWVWLGFWPSLVVVLMMSLVGIPICGRTADLMGVHDDGRIVWDEFAGQSLTLLPLLLWPVGVGFNSITVANVMVGFLLFRLFDVWKPWPISVLDRQVHGGLGIMLDDLLAGVFAALVFAIWLLYGLPWFAQLMSA